MRHTNLSFSLRLVTEIRAEDEKDVDGVYREGEEGDDESTDEDGESQHCLHLPPTRMRPQQVLVDVPREHRTKHPPHSHSNSGAPARLAQH